jgi:predicted transcriptional regulator
MGGKEVWDRLGQENSGVHGPNEKRGTAVRKSPRRKNIIRVNATAVAQMLSRMIEDQATIDELAQASGLSFNTVSKYLKALHKAKVVYVADWTEDKRGIRTIRSWSIGNQPDAKKPQPITAKEACAKYRAKMKQIKLMQQMTGQNK